MYKAIYFMMTKFCPNRCKYCYINDKDKNISISTDLIEQKIKELKPIRIIFFGGEPLVELDKIEYIYNKYKDNLKMEVVTSTSANYKDFINRIYNKVNPNQFTLQLSWDGFDNNRIDYLGNNISKNVYNNILWSFDNCKHKFDIKCVISEDNVKNLLNIHNQFLEWHDKASGQFVVAHRTDSTNVFFESLENNLIKTFTLKHLYSLHMNLLIQYLNKDSNTGSCDIGKYIVIDVNGKKSYCTALSQEDFIFNENELQKRCLSKDCQNCKLSYLCDGGCRYERYKIFGNKWNEKHLNETCKLMRIYEKCCIEWWDNSSLDIKEKILKEIKRYYNYKSFYNREGL